METIPATLVTGFVATAVIDLWALVRRHLFGTPLPNYAFIGRWIGHMPGGRFRHASIAAAKAIPGEAAVGWASHYLIGVAFAFLLPAQPTLATASLVGIVTVAAPFFVMQPAMGAGLAASRTPRPDAARLQSLLTHAVFGLGLYAGAILTAGWR